MFNLKSLFILALAGFSSVSAVDKRAWGKKTPKNFIMVIPDGFGPASETMARDWMHWTNNATASLPIDNMVIGQIRTRATDSYVTDSAASATAYSCGLKSYNGAIGVLPSFSPCGTVLEAAKLEGYKTGLIVTSRITHATPASYVAHVYDRDLESNIAEQLVGHAHPLGRVVDLVLGGGRCFFTPKSTTGSCRDDELDVLQLAKGKGYTVFSNRTSFDAKGKGQKLKLPYMGLFTQDHMSYEIDRDPKVEPSLTEMAIRGLDDLYEATKSSDRQRGFFVMVEASRIDHAAHSADATGHLHEILEYNEAMKAMAGWIDEHDDSPTMLISTADHECGGLTLGYQLGFAPEYWWAPEWFAQSKATAGVLATKWGQSTTGGNEGATAILAEYGITQPSAAEVAKAVELKGKSGFASFLSAALNGRLGVKWATGGHTGVDVTLYGYGHNHESFVGQHENTEVGGFVTKQLGLDLGRITKKLEANESWLEAYVKPKSVEAGKRAKRNLAMHHH